MAKSKNKRIFEHFQSMMIEAVRSHRGEDGRQPGPRKVRENEGILWSVNAMAFLAKKKMKLEGAGATLDKEIQALLKALQDAGLPLPRIDASGEDKFLAMVRGAMKRTVQGKYAQGVPQAWDDEGILWAGYKLARLKAAVRDLEGSG